MGFDMLAVGTEIQTFDGTGIPGGAFDVPDQVTGIAKLDIFLRDTSGNSKWIALSALFKRISGGGVTIVTQSNTSQGDSPATNTWNATMGASGNSFTLTFTGAAGVTVNWGTFGKVYFFSTL